MAALTEPLKATQAEHSPRNSSVPLLGQEMAETQTEDDDVADSTESTPKGKRRLFNFGKKKEAERAGRKGGITSAAALAGLTPQAPPRSASPHDLHPTDHTTASGFGSPRIAPALASPGRYRSSSPRLHSPASSQIFERNVQENSLPSELSPAIPSHIQTEDHIPAVLEASSLAITDDHLGPDEVEIVMHAAHQPASAAVAGESLVLATSPSQEDFAHHQDYDDGASNYGALDNADVRRLSFISFADVVHAEHAETHRESLHLPSGSLPSINRSPSPVRSPGSSHGISPPTSGTPSMKGVGLDTKAPRSPTGQGSHSPPLQSGGELMVETMRQALRKTGSGDLSIARSQPMSAVSWDEAPVSERAPFR